jgi:hypothetical protein
MSDADSSREIFELFQKMVNPMAFPMQSLFMAPLTGEELDKKIHELKTVQHWLNANLGMLELTIKTLEYQKAILAGTQEAKPGASTGAAPAWPWSFLTPQGPSPDATKTPSTAKRKRSP